MEQDQAVSDATGPMIHISVSGADIVTARMPYPHEQKSMGIGWVPVLVITRQGGATELYDATRHVAICGPGPAGRCDAGSESYRCILTAGHPGAHDPGPDREEHGPDCGCRFCSGDPWAEPAVTESGKRVASAYRADGPEPDPAEYRYHEPEPWQ